MPTAPVNGIELYYEIHGSGPPIVLAHGALGNRVSWWRQVPVLAATHRCIILDQRGFGRSAGTEDGPGLAALPGDLVALLDHLALGPAILIGQSLGGWTCLEAALRRPDLAAGLVIADSIGRIADPTAAQRQRERRQRGEVPTALAERALGRGFPQAHPDLTFLYFQISALNPPQPPDYVVPYFAPGGIAPETLAGFAIPTLFIVGEGDVGTPPEIVRLAARHIRGAAVVEIPGAGHSAHFEKADAFNRAVLDFIARIGGGK